MTDRRQRVVIVGASSLKGKELKDVLEERRFPATDIKLLDQDESQGQLEAIGDEVTFIQRLEAEELERADLAFFADEDEFTRRHWRRASEAGVAIVDLSYAIEDEPETEVRAPIVEQELESATGARPTDRRVVVAAHPAAVCLALLLLRAHRAGGVRRAIVTIFEPASEHGKRGLDELHQQTVNLLSFQQLPTSVFGAQVAYNMISRYGEGSQPTLESVERRIASHLQRITRGTLPLPSLMLLQVPTFHAHAFCIYIELDATVAAGDFSQMLAGDLVTVTGLTENQPSNVSAAGQDQILASIRRDAQNENAFWIWATVDNLRLAAMTAVDCAASLLKADRGRAQ